MKPSSAGIGPFREYWLQVYGEELSQEAAKEYAQDLLELGEIVYRHRITNHQKLSTSTQCNAKV
tara:strand:- start:835 stop:1026 length:192 start_codon:yes stop_codon:yes gene_type:complete